jgi:tRNA(His) guanylyltransferase
VIREDSFGDRMKRYEATSDYQLAPKNPVIGRLDGRAFHTLCRGLTKPVDWRLQECMWAAASSLCQNIHGARIAYIQSDEITILLTDYTGERTQAWFDYRLQKMCSIAAAQASVAFNVELAKLLPELAHHQPVFDARFWNVPPEEVANCFIWRQQDAIRNSISALAQANYSHKQLQGKNRTEQLHLLSERGIEWEKCQLAQKWGVCVVKDTYLIEVEQKGEKKEVLRSKWVVDKQIPLFAEERIYIEQYV